MNAKRKVNDSDTKLYLVCVHKHKNCVGRAICDSTENGILNFQITQEHSDQCGPDSYKLQYSAVRDEVFDRVLNHQQDFGVTYSDIVVSGSDALRKYDEDAAGMMNRSSLQRAVQRKVKSLMPPQPASADITFPEEWKHLEAFIV